MFDPEFYPTPPHVIELMCENVELKGKVVLEPSAGKGDIIDYLRRQMCEDIICCEKNKDLQKILSDKCSIIADDFFTLKSENVSHVDVIIMNPPFSNADKHILHAYTIAPPGCHIVALCNVETLNENRGRFGTRLEFLTVVENFGTWQDLGSVFDVAERKTNVSVGMVSIHKPGEQKNNEFEGFFLDDETEVQGNGIMSYNLIRDLVNRYVAAVKIFDEQLDAAVKMNQLTGTFYSSNISMSISEDNKPKKRNEFKKDLQKSAWTFIFKKMDLTKFATRGLREDINNFVEKQTHIPFTMKNIYRMIDIVIGTRGQQMDKAILEAFENITRHTDENRYGVPGWKTNSHYLLTKKFIMPYLIEVDYGGGMGICHRSYEKLDDLVKALCFLSGENYDNIRSIWEWFHDYTPETKHLPSYQQVRLKRDFGTWYDYAFFRIKGYKKGTMHLEFTDENLWGKFNQHVAKLKGYPLFEYREQTNYQKKQTGRK